jgi:hypothetical protein
LYGFFLPFLCLLTLNQRAVLKWKKRSSLCDIFLFYALVFRGVGFSLDESGNRKRRNGGLSLQLSIEALGTIFFVRLICWRWIRHAHDLICHTIGFLFIGIVRFTDLEFGLDGLPLQKIEDSLIPNRPLKRKDRMRRARRTF